MIGRIPITEVSPVVSFGGDVLPAKAIPGENIPISATIFREGHDSLGAFALLKNSKGDLIASERMVERWPASDHYEATLVPPTIGEYSFYIEAFDDPYSTWHHDSEIKIAADIDAELCCEIGAVIFEEKMRQDTDSPLLKSVLTALKNKKLAAANRFSIASSPEVREYFQKFPLRRSITRSPEFPIRADREKSLFSTWYEFFPRSEGATPTKSGTFTTASLRLKRIAEMGFDVIYLPPIHPIGKTFRKGANNSLVTTSTDPGVPWAIGSSDGGHDAINPELGTMADFEKFVTEAKKNGLEVALDLALQVSPDHPWVKEHSNWFNHRPDGSIAYAENPPKKYQDIYPINFDQDFQGILDEVLRIIRLWVSKGVTIFRVDNPHTKPVAFWEALLAMVNSESPEILFLAEAFTRPAMMASLGKVGFHQSYTYFTWRTSKGELTAYGNEVAHGTSSYFRPNFWVNTPDILPFHLQDGNPAMFALRAVLASTLSPSWGMYAGYELYEHKPLKAGAEEYFDSEKYEIRMRNWESAPLAPFISILNAIRKNHLALQRLRNLVFHHTDSEAIIAYSKREGSDLILIIVNLDPNYAQETNVHWDMGALGISGENFNVEDLIDGSKYEWSRKTFIRLEPKIKVAHIVHVTLI